jgi:hypothetical protein
MAIETMTGELDPRFSSPGASPTRWTSVETMLDNAKTYWIVTVRADGRPHATPLVGAWVDGALWFCTGPTEQKARNLEHHRECLVTTGCNGFDGIDVVVEGVAERVTDEARLQRVAERYDAKYGAPFRFTVSDGAFRMAEDGSIALVFAVRPMKILAFDKGESFSQTRWLPAAGGS